MATKPVQLNSEQLQMIADNTWRLSPARMAAKITSGEFKIFHYVKYIDDLIQKACTEGNARIVVSLPPRHGKSTLISLHTPTWFLSTLLDIYPKAKQVILASYEASFATHWGRQVRNQITEHPELGVKVSEDSSAADKWNLTDGGGMFCTGAGGPVTGRGGHLILVDDIVKNHEEANSEIIRKSTIDWFKSTLYTRAEPNASIIVLMTRWHEDDLAGYLLGGGCGGNWTEVRLPALAEESDLMGRQVGEPLCPERYSKKSLQQIQQSLGPAMFAALYQQRPSAMEGALFKQDMFVVGPIQPSFDYTYITVDTAYTDKQTSDYTCAVAWGVKEGQLFLVDVFHQRIKAADLEAPLVQFINKYRTYWFRGAFIEPRGHGLYLNQSLPRLGIPMPSESQVKDFFSDRKKDKVMRANNAIPHLSVKKIIVNDQIQDIQSHLNEVISFPNAKHDDFADCVIDGVKYWASQTQGGNSILDVLFTSPAEQELFSRYGIRMGR